LIFRLIFENLSKEYFDKYYMSSSLYLFGARANTHTHTHTHIHTDTHTHTHTKHKHERYNIFD